MQDEDSLVHFNVPDTVHPSEDYVHTSHRSCGAKNGRATVNPYDTNCEQCRANEEHKNAITEAEVGHNGQVIVWWRAHCAGVRSRQ